MAPVADGIVALHQGDPSGPTIAWRLDRTGAWTELGPWDIGAGAPGGTFTITARHDLLEGTDYKFLAEYHEPGAPDQVSQAWRSIDGEQWELFLESPPRESEIVQVGRGFIAKQTNEGTFWASADGRTWTELDLAGPDLPSDLGGGSDLVSDLASRRLVGVGNATFMIDEDRRDWWILALDVRLD